MKATVRTLTGLTAAALILAATVCLAEVRPSGTSATDRVADAGQARQQCDDLLRRARLAMAENDLVAARTLLGKAESLRVTYSRFHLGDTPESVRRDLERKAEAAGTVRPRQIFSPLSVGQKSSEVIDPFAARRDASAATGPAGFRRLPATAGSAGRAQSDGLLLAARRALAEGDVRRANDLTGQAEKLGLSYGPMEDSPQKVRNAIQSYGGLIARRAEQGNTDGYRTRFARLLMEQAEGLLRHRDFDKAEQVARLAADQRPDFGSFETKPTDLLKRIAAERAFPAADANASRKGYPTTQATGNPNFDPRASRALYDSSSDSTRNVLAASQQPAPSAAPRTPVVPAAAPQTPVVPAGATNVGQSLVQQGEAALAAHDTPNAMNYFRQAVAYGDQLDPATAQRLQDRLHMLGMQRTRTPSPLGEAEAAQQALFRRVAMDLAHEESRARAVLPNDPKGAAAILEAARQKVNAAELDPKARDRMLGQLDRAVAEVQQFAEQNRPRIELEERNAQTREQIDRERQHKSETESELASLGDRFNQLRDEHRFHECEVIAKKAMEIAPDHSFAHHLSSTAKFLTRYHGGIARKAAKEAGFADSMDAVETASIPFDGVIDFGDIKEWERISRSRLERRGERGRHRSEQELEIEEKLRSPVRLEFDNAPLSQVMDFLATMAAVTLHIDEVGLAQEGIASDEPVTINLNQEISLQSALNLILEPLHLSYVIKDEVLKITSEELRDGEVYHHTYPVADLVIPIPNFVPSNNMGLAGALHDALGSIGFGGQGPFGAMGSPMAVVASRDSGTGTSVNPSVMAQMATSPGGSGGSPSMPMGFGPGGMGGAAMADFDPLIELITTTIKPTTWDDVGGPGAIAPFATNLSIVVSQTQDVHEEIVDLLEQLRRLQDLQVTIEVRFITLNDNFFERIGVDFDFDIDDDIDRPYQVFGKQTDDGDPVNGQEPQRNTLDTDHDNGSVTVGLQQPGVFAADLDIPFTQNSFGLAVPQFGGFDAAAGAQLGFAILSDIEAFFFLSAAQGDRRSNVLQAPRVTLFNGQQAFVSDTSQSPFVISVVPVVGDFAAAQQPVVVILSEGTFLTVQAVVSDDRRFVRLTVVPFFSRIGDVETFTFEGSETTSENTSVIEGDEGDTPSQNDRAATTTKSGTTVQLPTFSFVSVTTTVSVPDGGTVLLGGIKRLSEGRNEFGVPMLSKLPYINRLFKNVGIGRETQSLMMMVTPRIIIQEEEESLLGIQPL